MYKIFLGLQRHTLYNFLRFLSQIPKNHLFLHFYKSVTYFFDLWIPLSGKQNDVFQERPLACAHFSKTLTIGSWTHNGEKRESKQTGEENF